MPASLIQQLAHAIGLLHRQGRAWLATGEDDDTADVHHQVLCTHAEGAYYLWVSGYVAMAESVEAQSQAILLLSNEQDTLLSWVGFTHAVSAQEGLYPKILALLVAQYAHSLAQWHDFKDGCLLALWPQCGRFSQQGQTDLTLNQYDLSSILNGQAA